MLLPAAAGRSLGVSADEVGSVLVSNPGIASVSATVTVAGTSQQVQIPVGTTLSVAAAGTGPVLVEADAPVVAAALSSTGSVGYPLSPTRAEESEDRLSSPTRPCGRGRGKNRPVADSDRSAWKRRPLIRCAAVGVLGSNGNGGVLAGFRWRPSRL
ncbi:hypothetical protein G7085_16700 [Tessaracoccus sp. HDW20]|uniref:hypothetical protein n=1 Tax=Tessaracoccus coleopterorum TaxID=2714950 RepID=UPI0018D4BFCC|nr:hypothetical protein [Tessaracoccus coleopterorum]NHB85686.1 hypothetical protein [Tessaracoccus coleopterorum]